VRAYGPAVRHDLAVVLERDHTVAEQAPALLGEGSYHARGVVVAGVSGGTDRLVLAHLKISDMGVFTMCDRHVARLT
jgi:hypothetical protein